MLSGLTDRVYEAAFRPELWQGVLDDMAMMSQSRGGVMQVLRGNEAPRWVTSGGVREAFESYAGKADFSATHTRTLRWRQGGSSFLRDMDLYQPEELAKDKCRRVLLRRGLGWQTGAVLPMLTGDLVRITVERPLSQGPHSLAAAGLLNQQMRHLSRAAMIATRLKLEAAHAQVEALERMDLPAAVMRLDGRVLAANAAFEAMSDVVVLLAFNRLALASVRQGPRLDLALERLRRETAAVSIPLHAEPDMRPAVLHLMPLPRSASELFSGGEVLVVVTTLLVSRMAPDAGALCGLFDLSPGEARLAAALVAGKTLAEAAAGAGITVKSARSYLERVFQKTVTHRQSELVALLKSAPWLQKP